MLASALVACLLAHGPAPNAVTPPTPNAAPDARVRTTDARIREWIRTGAQESSTFRALVARLAASDVIVYVEPVDRIAGGAAGQLYFVTAKEGVRYLRIEVAVGGSAREMIALVGHELQHAVEIAEARQVRDRESMALFYLGMPDNTLGRTKYDSAAARVTEERVRNELAGVRAMASRAPVPPPLAPLTRDWKTYSALGRRTIVLE